MNVLRYLTNSGARNLSAMFPGFFPGGGTKHNFYADFGYPDQLNFATLHDMYRRNPVAKGATLLKSGKTWETAPWLLEKQPEARTAKGKREGETPIEREIRQHFAKLRFWQKLKMADARSLVGKYSGVVLRLADGKPFDQPVERVPGGIRGLVEVIPAWEGQLSVGDWDRDVQSPTYGEPKNFTFNETAIAGGAGRGRSFTVHPDRVVIWSETGDLFGESMLEGAYNALLDCEKVRGSGAEGFWKSAKNGLVFEDQAGAAGGSLESALAEQGVTLQEFKEKMGDAVDRYQKGTDDAMVVSGGLKVTSPGVTLPSPEHFHGISIAHVAAACEIPTKILIGMQTGERASSEDAKSWAATCQGRRESETVPNIMGLINRLERFGILPERDWYLDWDKLTESGSDAKLSRASTMSTINKTETDHSGQPIFSADEIRDEAGYEPLGGAEIGDDDDADALGAAA